MKITIRSGVNLHLTHEIEFDLQELGEAIQYGFYGAGCHSSSNIDHPLMKGAEALESISNSIMCLADAINSKT